MSRAYDDSEYEKLSWREIDMRRDRSAHGSGKRSASTKNKHSDWVMTQYRKEAEKLFMGKKGTEAYKKALNEIHKYHGTSKFNNMAKKFITRFGLPDDWSTLFLFLDYKDMKIVKEVIGHLKKDYPDRSLTEMQGFKAKLEILSMTDNNKDLREIVRMALQDL